MADSCIQLLKTLSRGAADDTIAYFDWATICRAYGIVLQADADAHLRLPYPIDWLESEAILRQLSHTPQGRELTELTLLDAVDSSNAYLLQQAPKPGLRACLAEYQHAGRGRQGRRWLSPPGSGICLSVAYQNHSHHISGLNLAIACGLADYLNHSPTLGARTESAASINIKWPNDLYWQGKKLAGILIETRVTPTNVTVVIGVGLNVRLPLAEPVSAETNSVERCDLYRILASLPSRSHLAADLIANISASLQRFNQHGLSAFLSQWQQYDLLRDQPIDILRGNTTQHGVARGIDGQGFLQVDINGQRHTLHDGEVSVRRA